MMPTILLIDDDSACHAGVREAAEELKWTVLEAADGLQGLDIARRHIFTQQYAGQIERAARQSAATMHVAVFASATMTRIGLAHLMMSAGASTTLEAGSPATLAHILDTQRVRVLAAAALDGQIAAELAQPHGIPLLLVAATALEGITAARLDVSVPLGVVVADDTAPHSLAAALAAVASGQRYIPGTLAAPLLDTPLTTRERQVVVLDLQGHGPEAIAARLGVEIDTVHRYHSRIYQKLGVEGLVGLREWVEVWAQRHVRMA